MKTLFCVMLNTGAGESFDAREEAIAFIQSKPRDCECVWIIQSPIASEDVTREQWRALQAAKLNEPIDGGLVITDSPPANLFSMTGDDECVLCHKCNGVLAKNDMASGLRGCGCISGWVRGWEDVITLTAAREIQAKPR